MSHWRDPKFKRLRFQRLPLQPTNILENVMVNDTMVGLSYLDLERFTTYAVSKYLTKVNLSHNKLEQLPETFGYLINLTHLFVNNNYLSSLPTTFKQLKKLQELDLTNNKLKGLSENIADLKILERLYVAGNPLTLEEIRSLELMEKRRRLRIVWTRWRDLEVKRPYTSHERLVMRGVKVLELSYLGLESFPTYVIGKHVTKVNLSHNKLEQLPETFGDLINLTHLFVNNNYLSSLPTTFKQLKKLQELDLSNNKLKRLSKNIAALKILERLYVEGNPLTVEEIRSLLELMKKRHRLTIDIAG